MFDHRLCVLTTHKNDTSVGGVTAPPREGELLEERWDDSVGSGGEMGDSMGVVGREWRGKTGSSGKSKCEEGDGGEELDGNRGMGGKSVAWGGIGTEAEEWGKRGEGRRVMEMEWRVEEWGLWRGRNWWYGDLAAATAAAATARWLHADKS